MRVIAVVNQKGGCGKTTISINLASAIAELGHKTLLVDMDQQSHCAVGLAVPEDQIEQSIYDVMISNSMNEPVRLNEILWQISENLELAPASIDLAAFEQQMAGVLDRETALKKILEQAKDEFEYVIIDCPPAIGLLTFNALAAASDVIVPVETGYFALHGLSKQLETLSILCGRSDKLVNVKVLASMYDIRTKMAREILAELKSHFADKMFKTVVNFNTKIKEAASFGQPITEYDPASKGHADLIALAKEVLENDTVKQRHQAVKSISEQLSSISATADELLNVSKPQIQELQEIHEPQEAQKEIQEQKTERQELDDIENELSYYLNTEPKELLNNQEETQTEQQFDPEATNTKLSDYYGASQVNDEVVFVTLYPRAERVQIAGDFNNWQPTNTDMEKVGQSGIWQTKIKLPQGKHRYRLVVDDKWQQDPYNEHVESNPFGGYNSIIEVK